MRNAQEIRELANRRIDEANLLIANNYFEGAVYLAGYAVELSLKAKICELLDIPNLFDFGHNNIQSSLIKSYKSHDFEQLILLSGLRSKLQTATSENQELLTNWSILCEWSEEKRYCKCGAETLEATQEFMNAITSTENGIKTWIESN